MDNFHYTKDEYKKDAVQLSEYIKIMDAGLCPVPELRGQLTTTDRHKIQFVLGIIKQDELNAYLEEAENIIIQIDPEIGPSEDFTQFLARFRRGPTIGPKPPARLSDLPPRESSLASRENTKLPDMSVAMSQPANDQASPRTVRDQTSQFLDQLMSSPRIANGGGSSIHQDEKPRLKEYMLGSFEGDELEMKTIPVEEVKLGEPIVSHRGKKYMLRPCTCGFKGKNVHSIRMHLQHRKDPTHAWYNAKHAHDSIIFKCGVEVIGATDELSAWPDESPTISQSSFLHQTSEVSNFQSAGHSHSELSQLFAHVPKSKITEDSDYWLPSWVSLKTFEQNFVTDEMAAKKNLQKAETRLEQIQEELKRAEGQLFPERQVIVKLKREVDKSQAGITELNARWSVAQSLRREAENLCHFFKFDCKIHPNQLLDKEYLPETGLVNKPNLATIRAAINKLVKVREYWPEFEPEAWLRDRLATILLDQQIKPGNRDAMKYVLSTFANDPELEAIHMEVQHLRVHQNVPATEKPQTEDSKLKITQSIINSASTGTLGQDAGKESNRAQKRRRESSPEANNELDQSKKTSLYSHSEHPRPLDISPSSHHSAKQSGRNFGNSLPTWRSDSQKSHQTSFTPSKSTISDTTSAKIKVEQIPQRLYSSQYTTPSIAPETHTLASATEPEGHRSYTETEGANNSFPNRQPLGSSQSHILRRGSNSSDQVDSHISISSAGSRYAIRYLQSDRHQLYDSQRSSDSCSLLVTSQSISFVMDSLLNTPMPKVASNDIAQLLSYSDDQRLVIWDASRLIRCAFFTSKDAVNCRSQLMLVINNHCRTIDDKPYLEKIFRIPSASYRKHEI